MATEEVKPATPSAAAAADPSCVDKELKKVIASPDSQEPEKAAAKLIYLGLTYPENHTRPDSNPIAELRDFIHSHAQKKTAPWYEANKDVLDSPNFIHVETECHLPAVQATPAPRAASAPKTER